MLKRSVFAGIIAVVAVLQAWDSGVFGAGPVVIGLVLVGIALLAAALILGHSRDYAVWVLLTGAALIVAARAISPVGLNELFIIFPIAVMPFLLLHIQDRRALG